MTVRKRRTLVIAMFAGAAALVAGIWIWNRWAIVQEGTTPDRLNLGTVRTGSTMEVSARFLTTRGKSPWTALHLWLRDKLPGSWSSVLSAFDPRKAQTPAPQLPDLSILKPEVWTPAFVRVDRVIPDQRTQWYNGRPFFVLHLTVKTEQPGDFSGAVRLRLDQREAALPIRVRVTGMPRVGRKLLIAETPYQSDATADGSMFDATARMLSELERGVDCRHALPEQLADYAALLLAESCLVRLSDVEVARVRQFAAQGGRVILACDAFMRGTVATANAILEDHGLQVLDTDYGREVTVTNVAPDALTTGVRKLEFFRPSLVQVVDPARGKALAIAPAKEGALVAVSRLEGGGEIVVLGESMWWNWIHKFETRSDNARMLRNLLQGEQWSESGER